jgi:3-dehydroquinate dehydratase / shikimate dehydrogenase
MLFCTLILQSIGAINTIIRRLDSKLVGYNTDYTGAISAIEDGIGGPYDLICSLLTIILSAMGNISYILYVTGPGSKDAATSPLASRLIVVVGAGGAAKAIAYGAKEKGARVVVANRTYGKIRLRHIY